jgi:hypothetical protein
VGQWGIATEAVSPPVGPWCLRSREARAAISH